MTMWYWCIQPQWQCLSRESCHTYWRIPRYGFRIGGRYRSSLGSILGRRRARRTYPRRGECCRQWFAIKGLADWCLRWFSINKTLKNVLKYFIMYFIMPPLTSRIKNETLYPGLWRALSTPHITFLAIGFDCATMLSHLVSNCDLWSGCFKMSRCIWGVDSSYHERTVVSVRRGILN